MSVYLKVKGMTLAQEIRIIRRLERARRDHSRDVRAGRTSPIEKHQSGDEFWKLRDHRLELRKQARITHIAYTFLRTMGSVPFSAIERYSFTAPNWVKIEAEIVRFVERDPRYDLRAVMQTFSAWKDAVPGWRQPTKEDLDALRPPKPGPAKEIILDPEYGLGMLPVFAGTRIAAMEVVSRAHAFGVNEVLKAYPVLTRQDVRAAINLIDKVRASLR